ncbi:MAG: hypothetical protein JO301_06050, partial [Chitinophagaceae bacterium]|nr:hypothetical protein [Chitinophagaceae bacterium]
PEFMHAGRVQIREAVREVFICMGGSDPGLLTEQILGFLLHYPDSFNLHIVLARIDEDRRRQLENLLQQYHGSWELHINPPAISQVMLNADLGIINSGLIKYETSLLGLPCLSVSNDGSHESVMGLFAAARTIRHMGVAAALTEARFRQYFGFIAEERMERSQMAAASVSLFDTKGVARIFSEIQSLNN